MISPASTAPAPGDRATAYARSVAGGEVVASRYVRFVCARHLSDLDEGEKRGLRWDVTASEKSIEFFGYVNHSKGEWAGTPVILEPWECFIIGMLFGWKRADGTRRFRTALVEIARKNGKSLIGAGLGLLLAFFDGEQGAECYAAATKRDQAKIVWGEARKMVRSSPALRRHIQTLVANMNVQATNSKFEPLGADADNMDGLNIHAAIIDELHAHKTRSVWDVLETATSARRQPLIFAITTAGSDRNSVCWEQHTYAVRVLEDVVRDDSYFAYIATLDCCDACYEAGKMAPSGDCPKCDDWRDPAVWPKANPNLGISVKVEDIARKVERAKNVPGQVNATLRLHMNVWTESVSRWLSMEAWDECAGLRDVSDLRAVRQLIAAIAARRRGETCYAGLDLSSQEDVTALCLLFPGDDERSADVLWFFWIPEETVTERADRGVPYDVWVREGFIETTPGNIIDYDVIREKIRMDLAPEFNIVEIAYDPWGATQLALQLQGDGATVVPIGQTYQATSESVKDIEAQTLARRLQHGGNPVARWMVSNVIIELDAQDRKRVSKKKSPEKIDGVSALVTANARAITRQPLNNAALPPGYTADDERFRPEMGGIRGKQF